MYSYFLQIIQTIFTP